jgi:tetratricopeptide (TPR) repeat protein
MQRYKTISDTPQNVCDDLMVDNTYKPNPDWYCQKYDKVIPTMMAAMFYCAQYCNSGNCWVAMNEENAEKEKAAAEEEAKRKKAEKEKAEKERAEIEEIKQKHSNLDNAEAYLGRGYDFFVHGMAGGGNQALFDCAIGDFTEAIKLDPKITDAYTSRAGAYFQKNDLGHAIEDYDRAIQIDPHNAEAYAFRGITYFQKGKQDRALADFNEAIRLNPKCTNAYTFRGNMYFGKGVQNKESADYDKAIENIGKAIADSEEALRLEPGDAVTTDLLKKLKNEKEIVDRKRREQQEQYDRLVQEMNQASTEEKYQDLARQLRAMRGYKNTVELAKECDNRYEELKKERERRDAEERERERIKAEKVKRIVIAVVIAVLVIPVCYGIYRSQKENVNISTPQAAESYSDRNVTSDVLPENNFQATHKVVTNDGTNLRLRNGPGFNAAQIGSLEYGSYIKVLETGASGVDSDGYRGNWTYVITPDGRTGWCFGAYLQIDTHR